MSERNFSRHRRRMRFRPSGGLGHTQQRPDREATQARADAVGGPPMQEKLFDHRHTTEIERGYTGQRGQDEQNRRARKAAVQTPGRGLTQKELSLTTGTIQ